MGPVYYKLFYDNLLISLLIFPNCGEILGQVFVFFFSQGFVSLQQVLTAEALFYGNPFYLKNFFLKFSTFPNSNLTRNILFVSILQLF